MSRLYRRLLLAALLLAFVVIGVGAYVRLSDAGLGCPDWPGCYGHYLGVPDHMHEQAAAAAAFPGRPVETGKAWKEMIHRYLAGTLGLLVAAIAVLAWARRRESGESATLALALLAVVAFQAALGMWTVTLLLRPIIVTGHLLGGMATLALLLALNLQPVAGGAPPGFGLRAWAALALLAVVAQIALGGWVSSNYAALACADFPTCQGRWLPEMEFVQAFHPRRELGETAAGDWLPLAALTAIHWTHRVGALVVTVVVGALAMVALRQPSWKRWGLGLGVLLALQVALGIANVLLALPLSLAVAHNLGAAALLAATLALNLRLWRAAAKTGAGTAPAGQDASFRGVA